MPGTGKTRSSFSLRPGSEEIRREAQTGDLMEAGGYAGAGKRSGRDKTHKIMRCPGCGEKLRVPKGAGKINITCPHCGTKFIKKV